MKKPKRQRIVTTIVTTLGIITVYMIVAMVVCFMMLRDMQQASEKLYNNYGTLQGEVSMSNGYLQEVKAEIRNILYLYNDNAEKQQASLEALNTARDNLNTAFETSEKIAIDSDTQELIKDAQKNANLYLDDVDATLSYVNSGDIKAAREYLLNNGIESAKKTVSLIEELREATDKHAVVVQKEVEDKTTLANRVIGIIFLVIIGSIIGVTFVVNKMVCKPIVDVANIATSIAQGDINHHIEKEDSKAEISLLLNSFADMISNLKNQAEAMHQVAKGNLDVEYHAVSDKDVVGKALEELIKDNNSAIATIRNATNQISIGSGQIAAASQTLAQGSTEQASAIQQISASITDIAGKTKDNAEQATAVNDIVIKTKSDVLRGNERMTEMVKAMKEINESSENIQKIIKVIDDIAYNTNILALNATVEAARAGEQGKGFAVVAEEVRNLAGRSAQASSQTAEMIEDSIEKVRKGSELAMETAKELQTVSEMIEEITGLSAGIADASGVQASATAQIDQALTQVAQVVQTNSATSEQCASASEELSGQARGLEKRVAKYRLKDVVQVAPSRTLEYEEPIRLGDNIGGKY